MTINYTTFGMLVMLFTIMYIVTKALMSVTKDDFTRFEDEDDEEDKEDEEDN